MAMQHDKHNPYPRLALMAGLSFIAMYILMYAMVDRLSSVYPNLNQAYMAALMAAPMVAIEIALMSSMYVGSSRVDLQACKLEYSIVSPK